MERELRVPRELCLRRAKSIHRAEMRRRNEPPRLTLTEEVINAVTHGIGALLAVAALVLLLLKSHTGIAVTASCFYGVSMVVMMAMSCIYHAMPAGSTAKRVCRRFDYTSIYLLIGGTFAPLLLLYMGGRLGVTLFCVQWAVITFGVTLLAVFGPGLWRPLHFTLYFLIGWSGILFIPSFYTNDRDLLWFILIGGLAYTLGMIPFGRNHKWDHCVWHVCVLLGAALQWVGIYLYVY